MDCNHGIARRQAEEVHAKATELVKELTRNSTEELAAAKEMIGQAEEMKSGRRDNVNTSRIVAPGGGGGDPGFWDNVKDILTKVWDFIKWLIKMLFWATVAATALLALVWVCVL